MTGCRSKLTSLAPKQQISWRKKRDKVAQLKFEIEFSRLSHEMGISTHQHTSSLLSTLTIGNKSIDWI